MVRSRAIVFMGDPVIPTGGDDTPTIRAALAAKAAQGGGTVLLAEGARFRLLTMLAWPEAGNLHLQGGPGTEIVSEVGGGVADRSSIGISISFPGGNQSNTRLSDFSIRGKELSDQATYDLIQFGERTDNIKVHNVSAKWARHSGIRLSATNYGTKGLIEDCDFSEIGQAPQTYYGGACGIIGKMAQMTFNRLRCSQIGQGTSDHGLYFNGDYLKILDSIFDGQNSDVATSGTPGVGGIIQGCDFIGNGCNYFYSNEGLILSGNQFINSIAALGSNHMRMSNCVFLNSAAIARGAILLREHAVDGHIDQIGIYLSDAAINGAAIGANAGTRDIHGWRFSDINAIGVKRFIEITDGNGYTLENCQAEAGTDQTAAMFKAAYGTGHKFKRCAAKTTGPAFEDYALGANSWIANDPGAGQLVNVNNQPY